MGKWTMGKTVMIVDDESAVRYTVKHGLEGLDPEYTVICMESGEECLEYLKKAAIPDLILLDIMMPRMNGWEVQRRLKEKAEWRGIPLIFLTAVGDSTSKRIGDLMSDGFIEKPVRISELKFRIEKLLKS